MREIDFHDHWATSQHRYNLVCAVAIASAYCRLSKAPISGHQQASWPGELPVRSGNVSMAATRSSKRSSQLLSNRIRKNSRKNRQIKPHNAVHGEEMPWQQWPASMTPPQHLLQVIIVHVHRRAAHFANFQVEADDVDRVNNVHVGNDNVRHNTR